MIIQNYNASNLYTPEQQELNREIEEYKRINASLKKKIHAKDKKISYLFCCIDQLSKSTIRNSQNTETIHRNSSEISMAGASKKEYPKTQPRKKQKQNSNVNNYNIFKEKSLVVDKLQNSESFKLPVLDKKNIFLDSINQNQNPEFKPKVVRISKQKLIPIRSDELKKKFEKKFNKEVSPKLK